MLPLLANHNPTIVETFCYSGASSPDEYTRRVELLAHHWRTTARLSDEQLAQLIRDDQIDILIDLSLHSAGNRLAVFARRPAPVQGTYLAYCSTSGMDAIDFRITDIHLDPHGHSATFYSEASERLPGCYWCYAPDEPSLDVSELPATKNGFITFGSLNNFSKIGPVALDAFAATLRGVPNSRLLLHAPPGRTRVRVAQHFAKHQVDPNRVEFVNYLKMDDYFAVYQRIDMALDPFPCGGGTTSCDALWMGVPIITLAGRRGMERSGVTILKNLALEQCIATDSHDYARRAMALAGDLPALAELRSGLRARMKASPIMNAAAFARAIELIYRLQWTNWCDRVRQD
jgi:predicted O-linked N-acetylglucosamine transferase (SPINDLY family)